MYHLIAWIPRMQPIWLGLLVVLGLYGYGRQYAKSHRRRLLYGARDIGYLGGTAFFLLIMLFKVASDPTLPDETFVDFWSLGLLACLSGTVMMTVNGAQGDRQLMIASGAVKLALLLLLPLVVVPTLVLAFSAKRDRRFRDGTKGNSQTAILSGAAIVLTWLLGTLNEETADVQPIGTASLVGTPVLTAHALADRPEEALIPSALVESVPNAISTNDLLLPDPLPDTEDALIHLARDGDMLGEFSLQELREGLRSGRFRADDDVWVEGAADWVPLTTLLNA